MCTLCATQAEQVVADILPGFQLYKATEATEGWPAGWYGLVESSTPMMVIPPDAIALDPYFEMTDWEIERAPDAKEADRAYGLALERMAAITVLPDDGWLLVSACQQVGFMPVQHGRLAAWLTHHLATKLQQTA